MTYLSIGMLLAEETNRGPDYGKASPVGLLVVVLLLIGVFLLVRSMNRHIRKVPESFDAPPAQPEDAAPDSPASEVPPRESTG